MRPHRVVVLGLAPVVGYDLTTPAQIFGSVRTADDRPAYEVTVAGLDGSSLSTTLGYDIVPHADATALAQADTVVVPGTRMPGPRFEGVLPDDLRDALATVPASARLVSICTGAFVLGAAGVLDGRRATTHWAMAEDFRALYPRVHLDENLLFVEDGGVFTSAGIGAGVDLSLHLVRLDHGTEVANAVARYNVVPPWREGGQAQFIDRTLPDAGTVSTAAVRSWALEHLAEPLNVAELADRASMSVRTFTRRFRAETGHSPGAWLVLQRVREAQRLLESTDLPVDVVARSAGLGTSASLRQHLRRTAGVSPSAYRSTFRGAG
ncbi:GlxA family transcriptional regulator [Nocardioides mangrovicus]|nr:helix-turn-helix domain-containing protein [Nocardioides mangrovicus]